jgi:hypothetical protein
LRACQAKITIYGTRESRRHQYIVEKPLEELLVMGGKAVEKLAKEKAGSCPGGKITGGAIGRPF